jgi:hypothetical protein
MSAPCFLVPKLPQRILHFPVLRFFYLSEIAADLFSSFEDGNLEAPTPFLG